MIWHVLVQLFEEFLVVDRHDGAQSGGIKIRRTGSKAAAVSRRTGRSRLQLFLGLDDFGIVLILHLQFQHFHIGMRELWIDVATSRVPCKVFRIIGIRIEIVTRDVDSGLRSRGNLAEGCRFLSVGTDRDARVRIRSLLQVVRIFRPKVKEILDALVRFGIHLLLHETINPSLPRHHGYFGSFLGRFNHRSFLLGNSARRFQFSHHPGGNRRSGLWCHGRSARLQHLASNLLPNLFESDSHTTSINTNNN
mmetsp:Transcript_1910/g.3445  ORF Transcript_1910/g.3445 Transcript_1910/m.3445 type:complete len:250 (-) Transcript_1910:62-811(-)